MTDEQKKVTGQLTQRSGEKVAAGSQEWARENRGYKPHNATPLDVQNLQPPKGDSAVQPPQNAKPSPRK